MPQPFFSCDTQRHTARVLGDVTQPPLVAVQEPVQPLTKIT
jgi:hypothetical protein